MDPFGAPTIVRAWDDGTESMENAKRRLRVAFEFMSKLGVKYWTFHGQVLGDLSYYGNNYKSGL